ncbi:MBL fold metallo-hydrolase [Alkalihalobacterium elongatum]|uniref:MBL fold metallo-hydrolase n=1 Tax=Alkalihalobacterium elongatum TaxID=2675466 RepID=UPI001C1F6D7C|nr:MBL fold metallo-hydrolase [Alkalihalobacterium elongatum]
MAYTKYKQKISTITLPTPFLVGPVNVYLIEGNEALTLVDTGPRTEEGWELLCNELLERGYTTKDIEQIILTHHHPDHVGLIDRFENAKITGHPKLKPWLEKNESFLNQTINYLMNLYKSHGMNERMIEHIYNLNMSYLQFTCKAKVDHPVRSGDEVPGLKGWKVIETPGHAQTQIMILNEEEQKAISGDHLIKHISSNAIIEAPYSGQEERSKSLLQYRESLLMLKNYPIKVSYSGHGDPIADISALVDERVQEQNLRAGHIKELMGNDALTCDQITQLLFPKVYKKQPELTFSETLGHLDLLVSTGQAETEQKAGTIFYKAY